MFAANFIQFMPKCRRKNIFLILGLKTSHYSRNIVILLSVGLDECRTIRPKPISSSYNNENIINVNYFVMFISYNSIHASKTRVLLKLMQQSVICH